MPDAPWKHPDLDPKVLGRRIRVARKAAGLTQAQIGGAEASVAYISRIEAGLRRPSHRLLAAIADRLSTTVVELTHSGESDPSSDLRVALGRAELDMADGRADALLQVSQIVTSADALGLRALGDLATTLYAEAELASGRAEDALGTLTHRFGRDPEQGSSVRILTLMTECYLELRNATDAVRIAEGGARTVEEHRLHGLPEALEHAAAHARALIESGEPLRAAQVCRDALRSGGRVGSSQELADAYWLASTHEAAAGAMAQAATHLVLARAAREIEHHDARQTPLLELLGLALTEVQRHILK